MTLQQLRYFLAAADQRLVLGGRRVAADGPAEPVRPDPQAGGRARRRAVHPRRAGGSCSPRRAACCGRTPSGRSAAAEEAAESVKEVRTLTGGTVSFGTFGSAHHYLLGGLVQDFRRRYPDVRVRVVGQNSAEVADAVRDGVLEAGLVALPIDDGGLEVRPSIREENHYVSASPQRAAAAEDDRGARRGAADPLRRALGRSSTRCGASSPSARSARASGSSRRSRSST